MQTFDYIIVGAGSAGCVLANRLTADPTISVLLLEAGGENRHPDIERPLHWPALAKSEFDWDYLTAPEPFLNQRQLDFSRGKGLGGSSAINGTIFVRGNTRDFDQWAELGNVGWAHEALLPYFKRMEAYNGRPSALRGTQGPLLVSDNPHAHTNTIALVDAAVELGHTRNLDYNGESQLGTGVLQVSARNGIRQSSAVAYLDPIRARPNLTIATEASANQIMMENGVARRIEYRQRGVPNIATCNREIILSCGAIDSPKLLLLSGIGPAEQLEELGITPQHSLPGVGRNLQDHPITALDFAVRPSAPLHAWSQFPEGYLFAESRTGLSAYAPDLQFHYRPVSFHATMAGAHSQSAAISLNLCRPQSRGAVTLRTSNPEAPARIQLNFLDNPTDLAILTDGLRMARELLATKAMADIYVGEKRPGLTAQSDTDLEAYLRATVTHTWHPVGSCKMGTDKMAVVDPELKVHGIGGLRVVDASIMPLITSGNTNAPTMMIAEKGADLILGVG